MRDFVADASGIERNTHNRMIAPTPANRPAGAEAGLARALALQALRVDLSWIRIEIALLVGALMMGG